MPEIGHEKYFRDSRGQPQQDGGPLGAHLLGRRLGAPISTQRVPGGDGEDARGPGRGTEGRGQRREAGRARAPRLAAVSRGGSPRCFRAETGGDAARCIALGSLPSRIHRLACDPAEDVGEWWLISLAPGFLSLANCLGGGMKVRSRGRARPTAFP